MWTIITGVVSLVGLIFMIAITMDLLKRQKLNSSFMKNSPNKWSHWWEWFFWLTIILLIISSLPTD